MASAVIDMDAVDTLAARILATGVTPAAALAITDRECTLAVRTYGDAAPNCLWQLGSISKSMTAAVALQLVEEGSLDLQVPVTAYLPWLRVQSRFRPFSIHHLLTHTAGIIRGSEIATASNYDVIALAETEAAFEPGAHFWYSNVGYRVVGMVLEAVTGQPYPVLVQSRVLDRLGMRHSSPVIVNDLRRRLPPGHSAFYDDRPWQPEHGLAPATWIESAEADGSVCCTTEELAVWLRAIWNEDERLLCPASFAAMKAPLVEDDQEGGMYGYGLVVADGRFGHGGGMIGYQSELLADLQTGLGAVAFANGIGGAEELCHGALRLARGETPLDPSPKPAEPMRDDGSCPSAWRPYLGHYRSHNAWCTNFRVVAKDGVLLFGWDCYHSERHPLTPVGADIFRVGEHPWSPERLRFDTVLEGHAQRADLSGAVFYRAFTA
jgi:CubicO group peptidase (beta-lactamase class C family)